MKKLILKKINEPKNDKVVPQDKIDILYDYTLVDGDLYSYGMTYVSKSFENLKIHQSYKCIRFILVYRRLINNTIRVLESNETDKILDTVYDTYNKDPILFIPTYMENKIRIINGKSRIISVMDEINDYKKEDNDNY